MADRSDKFTLEQGLYGAAFLIAIILRFLNLGRVPLADLEASWALQALHVASGQVGTLGPQPGYILPTGLLFFLLGSSTALARLLPALVGSLMVPSAYFLRDRLGRAASLTLAFGLAIDPGLVALSRQADARILAVGFGLFAVIAWFHKRPVVSGVFSGLSLLSGPIALAGWLGIALLFGGARVFGWVIGRRGEHRAEGSQGEAGTLSRDLQVGMLAGGAAILLFGTLYLRIPGGIGAFAEALPAYLQGWVQASGIPASRLVTALLAYQLWPLGLGLVGAVRGWRAGVPLDRWAAAWFLIALGLAMAYPARQVGDLIWPLIPLWLLAARAFPQELIWDKEDGLTSLGLAGLIFVFLAYIWINLTTIAHFSLDPQAAGIRWRLIFGAAGLVAVSVVMIAIGWSWQVARRGLVWGLTLIVGLYTLGSAWGMAGLAERRVQEWWYPQPTTFEEDLLLKTVGDLSEWNTGRRDGIEIVVLGDVPSLAWALRDFPNLRLEPDLETDSLPALVITPLQEQPQLAAAYRGTDFGWQEAPGWQGAFPEDGLRWIIFRQAPVLPEEYILWARNDLFIDEGSTGQNP